MPQHSPHCTSLALLSLGHPVQSGVLGCCRTFSGHPPMPVPLRRRFLAIELAVGVISLFVQGLLVLGAKPTIGVLP